MTNIIKNVGPWLMVIVLGCLLMDMSFQYLALVQQQSQQQHKIDSLTAETDSLNAAVETREQINNKLIQTLK